MQTTEFVASMYPNYNIKRWMAAGASKRGWTTWLLGAVEQERLMGIAPVVMDLLNFKEGIQHMWQTLGNWTFAFVDYLDMHVPRRVEPACASVAARRPCERVAAQGC
jgi:PhoPQ-activated pathogenicity-related protein